MGDIKVLKTETKNILQKWRWEKNIYLQVDKAEIICFRQTCITWNAERSSRSWWEMIPDKNSDLQEEMKRARNGKYLDIEDFFKNNI